MRLERKRLAQIKPAKRRRKEGRLDLRQRFRKMNDRSVGNRIGHRSQRAKILILCSSASSHRTARGPSWLSGLDVDCAQDVMSAYRRPQSTKIAAKLLVCERVDVLVEHPQ